MALTGLGLDSLKVECLARWHSPMLAHYARLAPLRTLTDEYRLRAQAVDDRNNSHLVSSKLAALELALERLGERLEDVANSSAPSVRAVTYAKDLFVLNTRSNVWHLSITHYVQNLSGTTVCGWTYTEHSADIKAVELPHKLGYSYCERCLPKRRHLTEKQARRSALSSSSSSSSSG